MLCSIALTVYFASHSIRQAVVTTLACSLLLQIGYFGSVLFLVWRPSRRGQRTEHFGSCKAVGCQPPDYDGMSNDASEMPQLRDSRCGFLRK
ncbi:exopolysaccharide production repressor protein [Mesorhizobium kowhaii]|uniref:exopolysaccharide production repressor protein n=1 Tax=Mesorhizobium kowhaii TaxID=1300272 RepID=UPI0035E7DEE4